MLKIFIEEAATLASIILFIGTVAFWAPRSSEPRHWGGGR
jgi:hypothetical protein